MSMDAKSRKALETIQSCVAADRYFVVAHFRQRLAERGFFWPDALAVVDSPSQVRSDGRDEFDRAKWIVTGKTPDGVALEMLCVLDTDDRGNVTVFITIY